MLWTLVNHYQQAIQYLDWGSFRHQVSFNPTLIWLQNNRMEKRTSKSTNVILWNIHVSRRHFWMARCPHQRLECPVSLRHDIHKSMGERFVTDVWPWAYGNQKSTVWQYLHQTPGDKYESCFEPTVVSDFSGDELYNLLGFELVWTDVAGLSDLNYPTDLIMTWPEITLTIPESKNTVWNYPY